MGSRTSVGTRALSRSRPSAVALDYRRTITDRDERICLDLYEHKVLTIEQISELHFSAVRRARRRLLKLAELDVLERFRPPRSPGSSPFHYILGPVGIAIVAAYKGVEPKELHVRQDRLRGLAYSPRLDHLLAVNGFFSCLASICRGRAGFELLEWWSEGRCATTWGGLVRPDGLGAVGWPGGRVRFFLELDRGTENSSQLEGKLVGYHRVARFPDAPDALLFVFPTQRREIEARKVLAGAGMPIATATAADALSDPVGDIWLVVGDEARIALAALGGGEAR
ncbi:MAG: replication-relaxation family protein [Actinomycetota bacterium]